MYNEWSYNEWPDVDINGNVINTKGTRTGKRLTESGNYNPKIRENGGTSSIRPKVKAFVDSISESCETCEEEKGLQEADKIGTPEEDIEGEVENLRDCLIAALEEIEIPEDEELDPKVVLDAIVGCLADEDKEYLCSILCPEEEAEDELAELEEPEDEIEESCQK